MDARQNFHLRTFTGDAVATPDPGGCTYRRGSLFPARAGEGGGAGFFRRKIRIFPAEKFSLSLCLCGLLAPYLDHRGGS